MPGPNSAELTLHIDGTDTDRHTVPAAVLVQVLRNFQRAAELVGMHVEGKSVKDRARIPATISRKFQLVCSLPHEGSYAVPVTFGDPTVDLMAPEQIKKAWSILTSTISNVCSRQATDIRALLPDLAFRTRVLEAIKGMSPSPGSGWTLKLSQRDGSALAELDDGTGKFIETAIYPPQQTVAKDTITGELKSIDFSARKLSIIYPGTNKLLNCYYEEAIEDLLYENRRQLIQVTGRLVLDDQGNPREIVAVSDIRDVDLSSFEIDRVQANNIRLRAKEKIVLETTLDETSQYIQVEYEQLGILAYGKTRDDLSDDLHSQIAMMWLEYALADEDCLTEDAVELKNNMLDMFSEIRDAT